jgi:hypothetical protein
MIAFISYSKKGSRSVHGKDKVSAYIINDLPSLARITIVIDRINGFIIPIIFITILVLDLISIQWR